MQTEKQIDNRKILVVDDDAGLCDLIARALEREGHIVCKACCGREAVELAASAPPVLMLLDYRLPDMTGPELAAALAELGLEAPFVMMTGQGDERLAVELMKLGAADYLVKDTALIDRLPAVVERALREAEVKARLREAEESLREREANYRAFLESIPDIVVVGDHEGRILFSNPIASAKLGYTPDKLKNMRIIDLHPAWVRKEAEGIVADMLAGKRATCPLPLITRDGTLLPVETRVSLSTWNGSVCILGISKDLSVEQEALQKFEKLFGMNPSLMAVSMLPDNRFVDVNSAFLRILGYSADEVIGKTNTELELFVNPGQQQQIADTLKKFGRFQELEVQVKTKDGAIRDGLLSGEIIESQGKRYFLTVMIDITDRKTAENAREKTLQELRLALAEVKTLRGIVPICASCKKIRDDAGFWQQVEVYVRDHTEAEFTHGMCPECYREAMSQIERKVET